MSLEWAVCPGKEAKFLYFDYQFLSCRVRKVFFFPEKYLSLTRDVNRVPMSQFYGGRQREYFSVMSLHVPAAVAFQLFPLPVHDVNTFLFSASEAFAPW